MVRRRVRPWVLRQALLGLRRVLDTYLSEWVGLVQITSFNEFTFVFVLAFEPVAKLSVVFILVLLLFVLRATDQLLHHLLELIEVNLAVAVGVAFFHQLLIDFMVDFFNRMKAAASHRFFELFDRDFSTVVLIKVLKSLPEFLVVQELRPLGSGHQPFRIIELSVAVQICERHDLIDFSLDHLSEDLAES